MGSCVVPAEEQFSTGGQDSTDLGSRSATVTAVGGGQLGRYALIAARTWLSVLGQKRVLEAAVRARETAKAHVDYATQQRVPKASARWYAEVSRSGGLPAPAGPGPLA